MQSGRSFNAWPGRLSPRWLAAGTTQKATSQGHASLSPLICLVPHYSFNKLSKVSDTSRSAGCHLLKLKHHPRCASPGSFSLSLWQQSPPPLSFAPPLPPGAPSNTVTSSTFATQQSPMSVRALLYAKLVTAMLYTKKGAMVLMQEVPPLALGPLALGPLAVTIPLTAITTRPNVAIGARLVSARAFGSC